MTNLFAQNKRLLQSQHLIPEPVLVDICNVANWVQMLPQDEFSEAEFITNLPWERIWFEYKEPSLQRRGGRVYSIPSMGTVGILVGFSQKVNSVVYHVFSDALIGHDENLFWWGTLYKENDVRLNPLLDKMIPGSRQLLFDGIASEVVNAKYALTFCHCRNVTYYEKNHPEKLRKRNEKRGKIPQETYRILDIDGLQRQAKSEATESEGELKRALHICRGHFRTYTEANPLFGKVTGTFWVPMHKRGSEKHGKVNKDYRIKP